MKKVKYSIYQKLSITMMSIVIGYEISKDINEKFDAEEFDANMFAMDDISD